MKTLRILIALLLLLGAGAAYVVFTGRYDVSADQRPADWETFLFGTLRQRSVERRAQAITVPALGSTVQVRQGFEAFKMHCVGCHGGPGLAPEPFAMGLNPMPPGLDFPRVQDESDAELFWMIKNGIKHTGMPAFSSTLSEEEIWGLVSFLRRLPELDPNQFEAMAEDSAAAVTSSEAANSMEAGPPG